MFHATIERLRQGLGRELPSSLPARHWILLLAIVLVALDLRLQSVVHTVVDTPIRADARDYFLYAQNLRLHNVYSRSDSDTRKTVKPDALRSPGYPLFMYAFLSDDPTMAHLRNITVAHAALSTITVMLVFFLCLMLTSAPYALLATGLAALSPHLVTMNVYLLTETLFTFLIVLMAWLLAREGTSRPYHWIIAGVVLGLATLTRPSLHYFIWPLAAFLMFHRGFRIGGRQALWVALGLVVTLAPWIARNLITLGTTGDSTLMINTLFVGAYPNLMYNDDPGSFAIPYRFDPNVGKISASIGSALGEIARRFSEDPLRMVHWYTIGKPFFFFGWDMIEGMGDVFVYSVLSTPYHYLPHFRATHSLMHTLHPALVVAGLAGAVLVWLPATVNRLTPHGLYAGRLLSTLVLYYTAVHMVGAPYPRYSIPLQPFLYVMASFSVMLLVRRLPLRLRLRPR